MLNPTEGIVPKNGHTLRIIVATRVSDPGPGKQDERSIDDQELKSTEYLDSHLNQLYELTTVAGRESGEIIDREDYKRLIELVETGEYDLLITEDLGRIVRRIHSHLFLEHCVDYQTRVIAINDHVDTAEPGWEDRSIFSSWHHERSNRDTSDRIKRTKRSRFIQGGAVTLPIFGVIKPQGSKNDADWKKDPQCQPIYDELRHRAMAGESLAELADWLNEKGVPVGPYCRLKKWNAWMLGRLLRNPLLKGWRHHNVKMNRRHSDGKYRHEKAPPEKLLMRHVPHLAFYTEEDFDSLNAYLNEKNAAYRRKSKSHGSPDSPRFGKRTHFPGQMTDCGVCGRGYVFGGHGMINNLMCNGARGYQCWNGVTFDREVAANKIMAAVLAELEQLPEFDQSFLRLIEDEESRRYGDRDQRIHDLDAQLSKLEQEVRNLAGYIAAGNVSETVTRLLIDKERNLAKVRSERQKLVDLPRTSIVIPTVVELREIAEAQLRNVDIHSTQFRHLMRRLIPRIVVFPVVPFDIGKPVCRARFRLHCEGLLGDARQRDLLGPQLERVLTVDLFEPPQRIKHLDQFLELRRQGVTIREVAERLGVTRTAAQRMVTVKKQMDQLGITDPYVPILTPKDDVGMLHRHKHPRYKFDPLPNAGEL